MFMLLLPVSYRQTEMNMMFSFLVILLYNVYSKCFVRALIFFFLNHIHGDEFRAEWSPYNPVLCNHTNYILRHSVCLCNSCPSERSRQKWTSPTLQWMEWALGNLFFNYRWIGVSVEFSFGVLLSLWCVGVFSLSCIHGILVWSIVSSPFP